jgi:hypothetical protein
MNFLYKFKNKKVVKLVVCAIVGVMSLIIVCPLLVVSFCLILVFILLPLFWKSESRLKRYPSCLRVPPVNIRMLEQVFLKPGMYIMALEPTSTSFLINVYKCCWPSPAQSISGPSSAGLITIFYCLRFETRRPEGPGPRIYIPQEQGDPVIPPGTRFPFINSYYSQGHGGGIRTDL